MRRRKVWVLVGVAGVLAMLIAAPRFFTPGFRGGRFAACPRSPNCVSSRAGDAGHAVAPLGFAGEPGAAWRKARGAVARLPRTRVVEEDAGYLRAECRSLLFGFVDDLELLLGEGQIEVRSASRVGHSDLGANRRRVEKVRAELRTAG